MYLLSTVVATRRGQALLITAFACPLVCSGLHTLIHPCMLSLFMIPLLFYFYHRREKYQSGQIENTIVLILLAFAITYIHPVTCLFVILAFFVFISSLILYKQITPQRTQNIDRNYTIPLIMFIAFFMWYFSYASIHNSVRSVYRFLVYRSGISTFDSQTSQLAMAELSLSQIIELFIYRYSAMAFYLLISAIATIIVLKWCLGRNTKLEPMDFSYAILFIVACFVTAFSVFAFTGEGGFIRPSRFFLIIAPIISGLVIYKFIDNRATQQTINTNRRGHSRKKIVISTTTILILVVVLVSIYNVYESPRVVIPNLQVSAMDVVGTEWFSNHHDTKVSTTVAGVGVRRFEDLTFGREYPYTDRARLDREHIPSHFGYDGNKSVAETFEFEARYLLICELSRVAINAFPENVRPLAHHYTKDDFAKLTADSAVIPIYSNGEFEAWYVKGQKKRI
ncbi:hypothetical protein C5S39_06265 [Candidatus Methanophagaceae archaeon]|nr:hypothetical protein C5S39_06265 [Methanophagales archaeon]